MNQPQHYHKQASWKLLPKAHEWLTAFNTCKLASKTSNKPNRSTNGQTYLQSMWLLQILRKDPVQSFGRPFILQTRSAWCVCCLGSGAGGTLESLRVSTTSALWKLQAVHQHADHLEHSRYLRCYIKSLERHDPAPLSASLGPLQGWAFVPKHAPVWAKHGLSHWQAQFLRKPRW